MSDSVISVKNLGKKYIIAHDVNPNAAYRYRSLRDELVSLAFSPFRWFRRKSPGERAAREEFWALKDLSFDVAPGEVLGVIGRNGAGKSTLLKLLSRITEPTEGEIRLRGRVASLLEVGTGFHPELTGRENIYLNGVIMGMTRREVARKFDDIVAFAEIEKFLDTPVKRFSSGMYVRLAFAVAAHLEPEILLVDEVLAVGDAEFQRKCLGKMDEVAQHGRTVLFVSHNMGAVTRLCRRGIVLDGGQVSFDGPAGEAAARYLQSDLGTSAERIWESPEDAPGDEVARLKAVRVLQNEQVVETVDIRYPVSIELEYWVLQAGNNLVTGVSLFNNQGVFLFLSADFDDPIWKHKAREVGIYSARCEVPGNLFSEDHVRVVAEVSTRTPVYQIHVLEREVVAFQVVDKGEPGSVRAGWGREMGGAVRPKCAWATQFVSQDSMSDLAHK